MAARKPAPKRLTRFDTDSFDGRPELTAAAGLLVSLLKASKMVDLVAFAAAYRTGDLAVEVDDTQAALLERFRHELAQVSVETVDTSTVTTTLAVCTACGEHLYLTSNVGAPTHCVMTLGCEGSVVKAKAARRGQQRASA